MNIVLTRDSVHILLSQMLFGLSVFLSMMWAGEAGRRGRPLGAFPMDDHVMKEEMIKLEPEVPERHNIQIESIQNIMKQASQEVAKNFDHFALIIQHLSMWVNE